MRFITIVPITCIGISLILSFLALFAGTNHDMLETYDLLLINTSRIGQDYLKSQVNKTSPSSSQSSSANPFSQFIHNVTNKAENEISNLKTEAEQEISDDLNSLTKSLAKDLGIKDFYSIHIMNHCEGFFSPNGTANRNVTTCSNSTGISHFNLTTELQQQLNESHAPITLPDIKWPEEINEGIHDLELAFNASFILYVIGTIFTGIAFILGFVALVGEGRLSALLNLGSSGAAFLFVTIASIAITVGSTKAANAINKHGKIITISAARGDKFLSLTWAAAALLIVATGFWVVEIIMGRRRSKMIPKAME